MLYDRLELTTSMTKPMNGLQLLSFVTGCSYWKKALHITTVQAMLQYTQGYKWNVEKNWDIDVTGNRTHVVGSSCQCFNHWAMTTHDSQLPTFHAVLLVGAALQQSHTKQPLVRWLETINIYYASGEELHWWILTSKRLRLRWRVSKNHCAH